MVRKCAVELCPSNTKEKRYKVPKKPEQRRAGIKVIPNLRSINNSEIDKKVVCERHFRASDCFSEGEKKRLKSDVIPSLNLGEQTQNKTKIIFINDCLI